MYSEENKLDHDHKSAGLEHTGALKYSVHHLVEL